MKIKTPQTVLNEILKKKLSEKNNRRNKSV